MDFLPSPLLLYVFKVEIISQYFFESSLTAVLFLFFFLKKGVYDSGMKRHSQVFARVLIKCWVAHPAMLLSISTGLFLDNVDICYS